MRTKSCARGMQRKKNRRAATKQSLPGMEPEAECWVKAQQDGIPKDGTFSHRLLPPAFAYRRRPLSAAALARRFVLLCVDSGIFHGLIDHGVELRAVDHFHVGLTTRRVAYHVDRGSMVETNALS